MGRHSPCVPCSALFLLLLLLLLPPLLSAGSTPGPNLYPIMSHGSEASQHWHHGQRETDCWGSFDLYFILDKSGSVDDNWIKVHSFVADLVARFKNPDLRMSFIVFSRNAEVIMPLTADRDKIHSGLNRLQWVVPGGYTYMQEGFKEANEQIMRYHFGDKKFASVIIALTDGMLTKGPFEETKQEADKSRDMGAIVYTVGVLDYDRDQMVALADTPGHMFGVDSGFEGLQDIVDSLVSKSCLEVTSVEPPYFCVGEPYTVVIRGQGFHNAKGPGQVICRFKFSGTNIYDVKSTSVEEASITCPGPKIDQPGQKLSVDLSLNNGASFIGNRFNITSTECVHSKSRPVVRGRFKVKPYLKFLPALLLIPLLLCCCWYLWRRKSRKQLPPPPPEPETPMIPPPPRPKMEPEEEKLPPPPPPPPPPPLTQQPPPPPPPIHTSPTVIVSCCGCGGGRTIEGNLDSCCNYICPSCHQMPLTWCQPRAGRYTNITLMNPHCGQASCGQKICLQPNRKCCHIPQTPCAPRICLQPSRECFSIPEVPSTPQTHLSPIKENLPLGVYTQCHHIPARCSKCPSRILPLLSPLNRKSAKSPGHSHLHCPISKGTKTCN